MFSQGYLVLAMKLVNIAIESQFSGHIRFLVFVYGMVQGKEFTEKAFVKACLCLEEFLPARGQHCWYNVCTLLWPFHFLTDYHLPLMLSTIQKVDEHEIQVSNMQVGSFT